jgi:hypothetical protein
MRVATPDELRNHLRETHDDAGMINSPECWPNSGVLFLKSLSDGQIGIVLNCNLFPILPKYTVFDVPLNLLRSIASKGGAAVLMQCPQKVYDNAEAIVADGWIID